MINSIASVRIPSTRKTISGEVDPAYIASLKKQGVNGLMTSIKQLHPIEDVEPTLQKKGWKQAGLSEHFERFALTPASTKQTPFPIGQFITIANRGDVAYQPDQDVTLTTCKDGYEEQIISMDAKGQVTYNYRRAT